MQYLLEKLTQTCLQTGILVVASQSEWGEFDSHWNLFTCPSVLEQGSESDTGPIGVTLPRAAAHIDDMKCAVISRTNGLDKAKIRLTSCCCILTFLEQILF